MGGLAERTESRAYGGSAALLGFLYQLQATALRLLEATVRQTKSGNSTTTIQAILEPKLGGDALIDVGARNCVQFKLRSHPIGIGTLADSVLPDLFGAHCEQACDRYELQSNKWLTGPAAALFSFLQGRTEATATIERDFHRAKASCNAVFVNRTGADKGFDDQFQAFSKRLHLCEPVDVEATVALLLQHLGTHLPYRDQLDAKLDQLTGDLLKRATQNGNVVTGAMVSEMLGIAVVTDAQERLEGVLTSCLAARQYDVSLDVRPPRLVSANARLELIAGPSGNGKSWALCRLAHDAKENHRPAVFIRASDRAGLESEMRRLIAVDTLSHDSPIETAALGHRWRRHTGDYAATILVLWEGCRNAEELRHIHYQNGLGEGLQLVAELPPEAQDEDFRQIGTSCHDINEFTTTELFEALKRRGVNAGAVPPQIRRMLRHPVLCGFYAQLAIEDGGWNPANEYLVLKRFWDRARQTEKAGPNAGARIKALAKKMVEKAAGEVTDSEILALGFSDEQLAQLVSSGWLTQLYGKWRFAHDRLLTWAIAEWLAERFSQTSVSADEIASYIETLQSDSPDDPTRLHGLGFLMMDVLWLVASNVSVAAKMGELLATLEEDRQHRSSHNFYRELCPTIGPAIVDGLLARASQTTNELRDHGVNGNIAAAIRELNLPPDHRDSIIQRLAGGDDEAWKLLLLLGSEWPLIVQRERVWEGLVEAYRHLGTEQKSFAGFERQREAALCICKADPAWLETKMLSITDAKALGIATSLWREIASEPERQQWDRISPHLFASMDPDDYGRLIGFIRRLKDASRMPFLIEQIEKTTHFAPDALAAIAQLDPQKTLEVIATKPAMRYPPSAGIWLYRLLEHSPDKIRSLIDTWLMHIDPSGCMLATFWSDAKPEVGSATIAILLDRLDEELALEGGGDERILRTLLRLLGSGKLDPAGDRTFHAKQGSRLANNLRIRLEGHVFGAQNPLADEIWTLLLRIGGKDFEAYVINLLDGPVDRRGFGVESAIFAPTTQVVERLATIAIDWSSAYNDQLRKAVWRILVSLDPDRWYPRMVALLTAATDPERTIGLELFDDLAYAEDAKALVDCVRLTKPGSPIEARAINLAVHYDAEDPILLERALPRFRKAHDAEGHLAACNVLLQERETPARAQLDNFLIELAGETSWNSTDMEVLAIRLRQDDVSEALLTAAEPLMRRPSFFGERMIDPYINRGHPAVHDILLERAFGTPSIMTNEQPNMIDALTNIDPERAEEAFEQAWRDTPRRQRYLVANSRRLSVRALKVMLDCLPARGDGQDAEIAFRGMCIEFRRRHVEALPIALERYRKANSRDRESLVKVISWLPEADAELQKIAVDDANLCIRELAEDLLRRHRRQEAAVSGYRAEPSSIPKLRYALEIVDPELLYWLKDPWSITPLIQKDGQQTVIAEDSFVRRFNKVAKTRYQRVRIKSRTRTDNEP